MTSVPKKDAFPGELKKVRLSEPLSSVRQISCKRKAKMNLFGTELLWNSTRVNGALSLASI